MSLSVDKALRQAQSHLKVGKLAEAEELYKQVLSKFPKNKKALKGYQKLKAGISTIHPPGPNPPQEKVQELDNLLKRGRFEEVLLNVKPLIWLFPKSIALYHLQGASNIALNRCGAAVNSFKKIITINPNLAPAYYNMGIALNNEGDLNAAIDSFKHALKIKPDYVEVYINMGSAQKNKGELDAAIDSYKHALKIKPDHAGVHYNLGLALSDKGNLDAAIDSYKQALKIKPDYAEAYLNMGIPLENNGELDAAIENYKKAIEIKPDYHLAWNNMAFTLQATKLGILPLEEHLFQIPDQESCKYAQIAKSILKYRLNIGSSSADSFLNETLNLLSTVDNIRIENPKVASDQLAAGYPLPDKIIALVHFGKSGTGLLHSLIDGHTEISTLPSIYFSEFFDQSNWKRIIAGGWNEIADRFIATYEVLFDASSPISVATKSGGFIPGIGGKDGMASVGERRDEVLCVNKGHFRKELTCLMNCHNRLDVFTFFNLVHVAYENVLENHNKKSFIFYHIHNPDMYSQLNFLSFAPKSKWVMMVREPLQSCESWVRRTFLDNNYMAISSKIFQMLFEVDYAIFRNGNSVGVRLEDLKEYPSKTIPALCDWLGIKEEKILYEMTAQGKKWWGDPNSPDYEKDGMNPFGKTSINRKLGSVFSKNDQFILRTLFYPFSVRFGYEEENTKQFKIDLQAIRPMLDQMFDFEKKIVTETKAHTEQFMKSGSYLYLRSGMIERWNTLNEFHTYPNMIRPLKIN